MSSEPTSAPRALPPWLQFSLRQLLVWTAFVALACVALRNAGPLWVSITFGLTLLILAASLLSAVLRDGRQRAYWIGFALFGWLYALVLMYGWSLDPNTSHNNPLRPDNLATARLSQRLYSLLFPPVEMTVYYGPGGAGSMGMPGGSAMMSGMGSAAGGMAMGPVPMGMSGGYAPAGSIVTMPSGPDYEQFINVTHGLWILLLAAGGGWLATWLHATRDNAKPPASDDASRRG